MPATSTGALATAIRPTALPAPLALAEARVTQVEVELRLRLAEALLSDLEAERDQINAELAEVRSERDAWKVLATRLLLAPKRSWWSFLVSGRGSRRQRDGGHTVALDSPTGPRPPGQRLPRKTNERGFR
jgi:hypothetical protein